MITIVAGATWRRSHALRGKVAVYLRLKYHLGIGYAGEERPWLRGRFASE